MPASRLCLAVLVWLAASLATAADAPVPKGSLVIAGGGVRADNAAVWERIVKLAGGKGARIAVLPSAAGSPEKSGANLVARLNKYGANAFVVPIAVKLPGDYLKAANDPALAAQVRAAGGAFFAGGDQGRITQALRNPDGSNTLVLDALWAMYRRGGVIAGSSAGAAIMSSTMFYEAGQVLATLKNGVSDGHEIASGLGFIGEDVFVDQHLLVRGRFARMLPAMLKKGYKIGLGVDENTAMVVGPGREVEVIGYKGALLLDLTLASTDSSQPVFNVKNVVLSYLDSGDRYNLASGVFTPSADKIDGKIDPAKPYNRTPMFYADVLGNTTVVDLMERLIDSNQPEAIGIAGGSPHEPDPELGFEFKFIRTPASVGYGSASTDAYSVYQLRLDIRPIQLHHPLYSYAKGFN